MSIAKIQLGKNGITENFISSLKNQFKNNQNVKIAVLKSAGHERAKITEYAESLLSSLGNNYTTRIIGFTIVLKKWRHAVR